MTKIFQNIIILCLLSACLCNTRQIVYDYNGNITTYNTESDEAVALWGYYAKLIIQPYNNFMVAKFQDVQTIAYNGPLNSIPYLEPLPAPNDAHALYEPFIININQYGLLKNIKHVPNDELWSINMKKSIASIFQFDIPSLVLQETNITENLTYGNCLLSYNSTTKGNEYILFKNVLDCEEPDYFTKNKYSSHKCIEPDDVPFSRNITREYVIKQDYNKFDFTKINAESSVIYNNMEYLNVHYKILQKQVFNLISTDNGKQIDASKITVQKPVIFEFDEHFDLDERFRIKAPQEELIQRWNETVKNLVTELRQLSLDHVQKTDVDYVRELYKIMNSQNKEGFIEQEILNMDVTNDKIISDLLPLQNTDAAIDYFIDMFKHNFSSVSLIEYLANFPWMINSHSEDLLKKTEFIMELDRPIVPLDLKSKFIAVLTFATIVKDTYNAGKCTKQTYDHYVHKYFELFSESDDYHIKLSYLQGLFNLQPDVSLLTPFIRNSQESHHLRTLAIYAVKEQLRTNGDKAFKMFWPMVKNTELPLEMRIASLDVILSSNITKEHFKTFTEQIKYDTNVDNQYLYNYFYNTFTSATNTTKCSSKLTNFLDFLPVEKPKTERILGRYHYGIFEEAVNQGIFIETQVVTEPATNMINTLRINYERYVKSFTIESFAAYVKFEGLHEIVFDKFVLSKTKYNYATEDLLKILKQISAKLDNNDKLHMEVILYKENKAIFNGYLNNTNYKEFTYIFEYYFELIFQNFKLSYPVKHAVSTMSDLGTILNGKTDITSVNLWGGSTPGYFIKSIIGKQLRPDYFIMMRSIWNYKHYLESYNPIDNKYIDIFELHKNNYLYTFNYTLDNILTWKDGANEQYHGVINDNLIGSTISDETYLKKYCSGCSDVAIVSYNEENTRTKITPLKFLGKKVSMTTNYPEDKIILYPNNVAVTESPMLDMIIQPLCRSDFFYYSMPQENSRVKYIVESIYDEPTMVSFYVSFDYSNYSYFQANTINASLDFRQYQISDKTVLSSWNLTLNFTNDPILEKDDYKLEIYNIYEDVKTKINFDGIVKFPERNADLFSTKPVGPTYVNMLFLWGPFEDYVELSPAEGLFNVTATFKDSDESVTVATEAKESPFKECAEQSKIYQFTPLTDECYQASKNISTYRSFEVVAELVKPESKFIKAMKNFLSIGISDEGIDHLISQFSFLNISVTYNLKRTIDIGFLNMSKSLDYEIALEPYFLKSSKIFRSVYENIGLKKSCIISPHYVKTFTDKIFHNYEMEQSINKLAYIDCKNKSTNALVFFKYDDNHLGFVHRYMDDLFETEHLNKDGVYIKLNNKSVQRNNKDYYISDDVAVIRNPLETIYYNKEFIYIETYSIYTKYFCGLCNENFYEVPIKLGE